EARHRVVGDVVNDGGRDRHLPRRPDHDGVTVRRLLGDVFAGETSAGARLVFDDGLVPGLLLELLDNETGEQVVAATGSEAENDANRTARIIVGVRGRGSRREGEDAQRKQYEAADRHFSSLSFFVSCVVA